MRRTASPHLALGLTACLFTGIAASTVGCSSDPVLPLASGGTAGTVGSGGVPGASGGAASGGAASGGAASGGAASGGSGGLASGGAAAGGAASGGADSGSGGAGSGGANSAPATMTPGACKQDLGGYQNGSVTNYYFDQGTEKVNCEFTELGRNPDRLDFVETNDGMYFGAMNTADYDTAAACGACAEVTRDGDRKVVITIADRCPIETNPKCKNGHIDLSQAAFDQIGNRGNEGYLGTSNGGDVGQISWKYVPCPGDVTVHLSLKEPENAFWNQVLVTSHTYAIESVDVLVDGSWVSAVRQPHNHWEPPEGIMGDAEPYRVRITDVNGSVLEAPLPRAAGAQDTGLQFSCN